VKPHQAAVENCLGYYWRGKNMIDKVSFE
jgi:hypothetical protein